MMDLRRLVSAVALLALAGCGGSGSGVSVAIVNQTGGCYTGIDVYAVDAVDPFPDDGEFQLEGLGAAPTHIEFRGAVTLGDSAGFSLAQGAYRIVVFETCNPDEEDPYVTETIDLDMTGMSSCVITVMGNGWEAVCHE